MDRLLKKIQYALFDLEDIFSVWICLSLFFCFVSISADQPIAWDDFNRPDADMETGDVTPSGHSYRITGLDRLYIQDGQYHSDALKRASIAYIFLDNKPKIIKADFMFSDDQNPPQVNGENAVIGTAEGGFGLGSVQLGIWRDQWQLFVVQHPIIDPYPILVRELFEEPLEPGKTYSMSLEWDETTSSMSIVSPDGSVMAISHPEINLYWGRRFGVQQRRGREDFGKIIFTKVEAF